MCRTTAPYGFRRYRLAEIGWFFPWVVEQGETIARELASWFYCEGCHESCPLADELGGDGLCWACYECCACEWEQGCGGTGVVHCRGCGGDQCICTCGGELECDGCDDCEHNDVSSPADDGYDSDYSDE